MFELAFQWLEDRIPSRIPLRLIHGDFRIGNLIMGRDGVRAVLDWELAHLGDPAEDLAWMCLPPWRFGEFDKETGGLGAHGEFLKS